MQGFSVGVSGKPEGTGIDLWNYDKMAVPKGSEESARAKLYGLSKVVRKDILNREFLRNLNLPSLCVGGSRKRLTCIPPL